MIQNERYCLNYFRLNSNLWEHSIVFEFMELLVWLFIQRFWTNRNFFIINTDKLQLTGYHEHIWYIERMKSNLDWDERNKWFVESLLFLKGTLIGIDERKTDSKLKKDNCCFELEITNLQSCQKNKFRTCFVF
jgi:hypothetical protein